jgi:hypothetical protein
MKKYLALALTLFALGIATTVTSLAQAQNLETGTAANRAGFQRYHGR